MASNTFKLPVLHKNKNINLAIYIVILALIVYVGYRAYKKYRPGSATLLPTGSTTQEIIKTPTGTVAYDNNTVFSWKSPLMISDRVQWMQDAYNRIARLRAAHYLSSWPIITEDSKFGENTEKAMVRMTGKKAVTWTEVKARAEALTAEITRPMPGYGGSW